MYHTTATPPRKKRVVLSLCTNHEIKNYTLKPFTILENCWIASLDCFFFCSGDGISDAALYARTKRIPRKSDKQYYVQVYKWTQKIPSKSYKEYYWRYFNVYKSPWYIHQITCFDPYYIHQVSCEGYAWWASYVEKFVWLAPSKLLFNQSSLNYSNWLFLYMFMFVPSAN